MRMFMLLLAGKKRQRISNIELELKYDKIKVLFWHIVRMSLNMAIMSTRNKSIIQTGLPPRETKDLIQTTCRCGLTLKAVKANSLLLYKHEDFKHVWPNYSSVRTCHFAVYWATITRTSDHDRGCKAPAAGQRITIYLTAVYVVICV